jgi:hypothetical protein
VWRILVDKQAIFRFSAYASEEGSRKRAQRERRILQVDPRAKAIRFPTPFL